MHKAASAPPAQPAQPIKSPLMGGSSLVDTNRRLAEAESKNYLEYIIAFDESRAVDSYIPANDALVSNAIAESSETVNYSLYGRVLADENSVGVVGTYSDTLGITVTY